MSSPLSRYAHWLHLGWPAGKVEKLLTELIDRGILEVRKKGGKTEQARGASIKMYFLASDYHYKPKLN